MEDDAASHPMVYCWIMRVGHYEVIDKLASGRAEVMVARDTRLPTTAPHVVIKIASDDEPDFERELTVLRQLRHKNVVSLLDFGSDNGRGFLALEYIPGLDLAQLLGHSGPLDLDLAVFIAREVLLGLTAAHAITDETGRSLGVVHRDVTPSNVLVSASAGVKLADFGIAKYLHAPRRTATGIIKGKFAYLSPEQAKSLPIDARTDVYAVGLLLFEMLTNQPAYKSTDDYELIELAMGADLSKRWEILPASAEPVMKVLRKALAPTLSKRIASAHEFAEQLSPLVPHPHMAQQALTSLVRHASSPNKRED